MGASWWAGRGSWIVAAVLAGCAPPAEVIACPVARYDQATLDDCECTLGPAPGLLTAVVAGPGAFGGNERVSIAVGTTTMAARTAGDGSLAVLVPFPEPARDPEPAPIPTSLTVTSSRGTDTLVLPAHGVTEITGTDSFVESALNVLTYVGAVRGTARASCDGDAGPTPRPVHLYAADLTQQRATVTDAPPVDTTFSVDVRGGTGDVAIVAVTHQGGGVSGCFLHADECCDCPGGPGSLRLPRARCGDRQPGSGRCWLSSGPPPRPDAGLDAGRDAQIVAYDAGPLPDVGAPP